MRNILTMILSFASLGLAAAQAAERSLTFGIVPQQSAAKLAEGWTPAMKHLSASTGYQIRFATAKDIPTFEKNLAAGEYDLAYMNPYHYTVFSRKPGYVAIAKEADTRLKGVIVAHKDAPYQSLQDLAGRTLAFPAPAAFAATVLPLANFARQGIEVRPKYVTSHESVYLAVAQGLFPAGGGVVRTFEAMPTEVKDRLRIVWTTDGYTPHAIAAHPRLPKTVRDKVAAAMLAMNDSPDGKSALAGINFKGIASASDAEWNDVRGLRIGNLKQLLQE